MKVSKQNKFETSHGIVVKPVSEKIRSLGLKGIGQLLAEDEMSILRVQCKYRFAKTTRQIRNYYLQSLVDYSYSPKEKEERYKSEHGYHILYSFLNLQLSKDPFRTGKTIPSKYFTEITKLKKLRDSNEISETEYFKLVEHNLRDAGFKILSYDKIERILHSLENLNLVIRRQDPLVNAKQLWIINPIFLELIEKEEKISK